jgi:hypothetical protein
MLMVQLRSSFHMASRRYCHSLWQRANVMMAGTQLVIREMMAMIMLRNLKLMGRHGMVGRTPIPTQMIQ